MKDFYLGWEILPTPSAEFEARVKLPAGLLESVDEEVRIPSKTMANVQSPSAESCGHLFSAFPLSWSHYVRLMAVEKPHARAFYEAEAIRGGWSVRQLDRQIGTQFFERTANSKRQAALWARGRKPKPEDAVSVEDEVRDPYLLEFLNLSDEYTYAKKHLTEPGESDPVGIILCSGKDDAVVEYAMGGINARVFASKYLTQLPDEETLRNEIETTRRALLHRLASKNAGNERRGDTEKK